MLGQKAARLHEAIRTNNTDYISRHNDKTCVQERNKELLVTYVSLCGNEAKNHPNPFYIAAGQNDISLGEWLYLQGFSTGGYIQHCDECDSDFLTTPIKAAAKNNHYEFIKWCVNKYPHIWTVSDVISQCGLSATVLTQLLADFPCARLSMKEIDKLMNTILTDECDSFSQATFRIVFHHFKLVRELKSKRHPPFYLVKIKLDFWSNLYFSNSLNFTLNIKMVTNITQLINGQKVIGSNETFCKIRKFFYRTCLFWLIGEHVPKELTRLIVDSVSGFPCTWK